MRIFCDLRNENLLRVLPSAGVIPKINQLINRATNYILIIKLSD